MLHIYDVSTFYKVTQALFQISMEVPKGEIVSLLGANGAGKTTTLKTISGLLSPSSGTITYLGNRIESLSARNHCKKRYIPMPRGTSGFYAYECS